MRLFLKSIAIFAVGLGLGACNTQTGIIQSVTSSVTSSSEARFASGLKAVKVVTGVGSLTPNGSSSSVSGSFSIPTAVPTPVMIPASYPGYDGLSDYLPGVSANLFYDLDGVTPITVKPGWLFDFQLGITSTSAGSACATFGGSGTYDASGYYRVSEKNCASVTGNGSSIDPVFMRIILNRDSSQLGSAENLLIQIEYQANGLRTNADGIGAISDSSVDQLWKVFWNSSLNPSLIGNGFSTFVPPSFAHCELGGTGSPTPTPALYTGSTCPGNPSGAPISVKQILIPLSANPSLSVIQISRVVGRINNPSATMNYVANFCPSDDSPLCLGVVIRSVTLMRI